MQIEIRTPDENVQPTLIKSALLVAARGAWRWQQRLRRVEYVPTRLGDGRIVWGMPITIDGKVSGGNWRSKNCERGERSPLWSLLSDHEMYMVNVLRLRIFNNGRLYD